MSNSQTSLASSILIKPDARLPLETNEKETRTFCRYIEAALRGKECTCHSACQANVLEETLLAYQNEIQDYELRKSEWKQRSIY